MVLEASAVEHQAVVVLDLELGVMFVGVTAHGKCCMEDLLGERRWPTK